MAPTTEPMPLVFSIEEVIPVTARDVVVAWVVVDLPNMENPRLALVEKRLVDEAVVEKEVVEVPLVVVELRPVKFWRVVELFARTLVNVPSPVEVRLPP